MTNEGTQVFNQILPHHPIMHNSSEPSYHRPSAIFRPPKHLKNAIQQSTNQAPQSPRWVPMQANPAGGVEEVGLPNGGWYTSHILA